MPHGLAPFAYLTPAARQAHALQPLARDQPHDPRQFGEQRRERLEVVDAAASGIELEQQPRQLRAPGGGARRRRCATLGRPEAGCWGHGEPPDGSGSVGATGGLGGTRRADGVRSSKQGRPRCKPAAARAARVGVGELSAESCPQCSAISGYCICDVWYVHDGFAGMCLVAIHSKRWQCHCITR